MLTKTGKAIVTQENTLIPVAYDGDCASVPIADPSVDTALKSFEWKPGYVGFKFAEAVKGKIKLDGSDEEVTFSKERRDPTSYLFATKVITRDEFANAAEYKDPASESFRKLASWALEDEKAVLFASERGLKILQSHELGNTVLINKQGQQLFPPKNG